MVALQRHDSPELQVVSLNAEASNRSMECRISLKALWDEAQDAPISYEAARTLFAQDHGTAWAGYALGSLVVLMHEKGARFTDGVRLLVHSQVPEGKGVSSSAAVEVAAMKAVSTAYGIPLEGRELAILCQMVENRVVGAPCGVMDQMASALGKQGRLLALLCRPAEVMGYVEIPDSVAFFGIDSGVVHSVGGSDYGSVRCAAFMGKAILGMGSPEAAGSEDDQSPHCLCELTPSRFAPLQSQLPETITGQAFVAQYGDHNDPVTTIDEHQEYAVRSSATHPIFENFRVEAFRGLLQACAAGGSTTVLPVLGELMLQSHESYTACGLGSEGTDHLVQLARDAALTDDIFGAKITGGGSGGTVCVMGAPTSGPAIEGICAGYQERNGHTPYVFRGSSPGAEEFGHLKVRVL